MRRFRKLLWMIFIFWVVFFIICDEKWYKIWFENNQIVFSEREKKPDPGQIQFNPNAVYKNSDIIRINPEFENSKNLRKSNGVDKKYLAKLEKEKKLEEEKIKAQENKHESNKIYEDNTILSAFQWNIGHNTGTAKEEVKENTSTAKQEVKQKTGTVRQEVKQNTGKDSSSKIEKWETSKTEIIKPIVYYPIKKYEYTNHVINFRRWVEIPKIKIEKYTLKESLAINITKWVEPKPKILYKNLNKIQIYSGFESPINMLNSDGIDEEFLLKQKTNNPTIISLDNEDTISSTLGNDYENNEKSKTYWHDTEEYTDSWLVENILDAKNNKWLNNGEVNENTNFQRIAESSPNISGVDEVNFEKTENLDSQVTLYKVKKFEYVKHSIMLRKSVKTQSLTWNQDNYMIIDKPELSDHVTNISKGRVTEPVLVSIEKYQPNKHAMNPRNWVEIEHNFTANNPEILVSIEKYQPNKHTINLRKWVKVKHNFVVDNPEGTNQTKVWISDSMFESLLENEEIDINTLESENDEFLQKIFEKTKDKDIMNLIVETYLSEYQFIKAKKFVESLSDIYLDELDPLLNLRVAFNSFPLSSKTINENLTSIVQDYASKNKISNEDRLWYLWIIALIDRNYDKFFEISAWFTSEKYRTFAQKLLWYKNQIAKQMWMPAYYFDTLTALELFNQWLFQPAKILSLYSLQQNSNYILPYQVLAYANFLTNSRDTSIEYFKKLVDIDPNNAEKYRFLMWIAFYRDEKYEQSVVMLSLIKDEKLRLDTQRYLINNYLKLNQKNRLISTRNKLLWYESLVSSDFYTYFYETFFHPYAEWAEYQLYAFDTELANKMLRACSTILPEGDRVVCTYWTIGRNIALWQFDGIEQYLLNLVAEYPQWYLYQALGDYYVQQWDLEKAKAYLLKAVSLTQERMEKNQIKKLLQDIM